MFATTIAQDRPHVFPATGGSAADAIPAATAGPALRPEARSTRPHPVFRGTRIVTAVTLGWAGVILFAFGAIAVPAAHGLGRAAIDPGLMALLGSVAPLLWGLGIAHVVAAVGIARDREGWGFRLGLWTLAGGVLVVAAGMVFALAGRDPFALADPASPSAANGVGLLTWTLGLYALVGWGLRRVLVARGLA